MSNKDKQDGNEKDSGKDDEKSIPKGAQSKATFDERVEAAYNDCFAAVGTEEVVNIIESLDEDVRNDVLDKLTDQDMRKTIDLLHGKLKGLKATLLTATASVFVITVVAVMGSIYSVDKSDSLQEHAETLAFKNLQLTEDNARLQTQASNCLVSSQDANAFKQRVYQSMQEINRHAAAVMQEINRQVAGVMDDVLLPVPEVTDDMPLPEVMDDSQQQSLGNSQTN